MSLHKGRLIVFISGAASGIQGFPKNSLRNSSVQLVFLISVPSQGDDGTVSQADWPHVLTFAGSQRQTNKASLPRRDPRSSS